MGVSGGFAYPAARFGSGRRLHSTQAFVCVLYLYHILGIVCIDSAGPLNSTMACYIMCERGRVQTIGFLALGHGALLTMNRRDTKRFLQPLYWLCHMLLKQRQYVATSGIRGIAEQE